MKANHWRADGSVCEICGTPFGELIPEAEMYDPSSDDGGLLCHKVCGELYGLTLEWERQTVQ